VEAENSAVLSSARADAEGLTRKIILLEDEHVEEHRAHEASERENQERFEELTLLQTRGSELCLANIGLPWARDMSEGMRLATLRHTEMVGELATFRAMVSSVMDLVLGHSPSNTACAEVVGELATEF
jgi:hypothetical protein